MALAFSDNFNDNSLDTTNRWNKVDSGTNVTESGGTLNIVGNNSWNANGVFSKAVGVSGDMQIRLIFDVTTPVLGTNTDFLGGFSTNPGLSTGTHNEFQVQLRGTEASNHILVRNSTGTTDTGYTIADSTKYTFRMTLTKVGATITGVVEIKGGAYTNWTTIFSNLAYSNTSPVSQRVQFQAYASGVTYSVDNVETWVAGNHLSFADNFNDNSLNSALWASTVTGAGSVTETSQQLQIKGDSTSWNHNGVVTKNFVVGFYAQAVFDLTMPADLLDSSGFVAGFSRSSTLSYNNANCFELYINPTHSPHNVRVLTDVGTANETTIDVAASTTYTFRMTWDYTGANPSVLIEIKGGAYSTWTPVYQNTNYGDVLLTGQYFQMQVFSSSYTYKIDNFSIYEKTFDLNAINIGDSLAVGNQDGTGTNIAQRLQLLNGWMTLQTGIGAQTTSDIAGRFNGDAVYRMAERIFVTAGTNDPYYSPNLTLDQTLANLQTMLTAFNAAPVAGQALIFCEPPPRSHSNPPSGLTDDQYREWLKKIYAEYREFCVKNSVNLAPSFQELANTGTNATSGVITSCAITNGGTGYPASGTVSFTGGGGSGATANYVATSGVITAVNMTNEGAGYTGNATAVFSGGGSGATGTGNVSIDDAIPQNYVYLADNVGVHLVQAGYNRMGDMYNVYAVPSRTYRWGNTAYPAVNDESWKWWVWSAGNPTITGNADTGDLNLPQNASADSDVKCLARAGAGSSIQFTLTPTVSSGSVTVKYRISQGNFNRNDSAAWTTYSGPVTISNTDVNNTFIQIRLVGAGAGTAVVSELSMTWSIITYSTVSRTATIPVEFLKGILEDRTLQVEWLGLTTVNRTATIPLEFSKSIFHTSTSPVEYQASLQITRTMPVGITKGILADKIIPFEWRGLLPVGRTATIPLEWMGLNIMANAGYVFPALPGLAWNVVKQPEWATLVKRSISGKEVRAALMSYPLWTFKMSYEVLRDDTLNNELKTLMGFFLARQGSFESFFYSDPSDSSVSNQSFGVGNGSTTTFQLTRPYGGFVEPIQNLNGNPLIYVNGVLKTAGTDYTLGPTGIVTFASAPPSGATVTWSGSFYYRVRFAQDLAEFNNFMYQLWDLKKLELLSVKL